jgi:hypothetical protein
LACIVYYILAHKEPERVARLVNRLKTPSDYFFINFGSDISKHRFNAWKSLIEKMCPQANLKIVSEYKCKWGSFEAVLAILNAMKFYDKFEYDHFINLSGECYPIKPVSIIKQKLNGQTSSFMEFFEMPAKCWKKGGLERFQYRHYFPSLPGFPIFRIPRLKWIIPCGLQPYGGSLWFCLSHEHVSYVLNFLENHSEVRSFFKRVGLPDEVFFQTILLNSPFSSKIENNNLRYIDWVKGEGGHPKYLAITVLDEIFASDKLFARKFSLFVDKGVLDAIDHKIDLQMMKKS